MSALDWIVGLGLALCLALAIYAGASAVEKVIGSLVSRRRQARRDFTGDQIDGDQP